MFAPWPLPLPVYARYLGWRAGRIADPVERLHFLRTSTGRRRRGRPRLGVRLACVGWVAAASIVLPGRISSHSRLPARPMTAAALPLTLPAVWLYERGPDFELYSNGLRIETRFAVAGTARRYRAISRHKDAASRACWRTEPAGIVFHSSEGETAPLEPEQAAALHRQGAELLAFVQRHELYNFVIDRLGRVHRVVEEHSPAWHAGHSIWADPDWIYLNLNGAFLAVCFEGHGRAGGISPAQVHAGRVLTDMLRARYHIPGGNCVGHAQVSVNPSNFLVGYHTDWAAGLPFAGLALPENARQPLPSLFLFGFEADSSFVAQAGADLRHGLELAVDLVSREAADRRLAARQYRQELRRNYRELVAVANNPGNP